MHAAYNLADEQHQHCKGEPAEQGQLAGGSLAAMSSKGIWIKKEHHMAQPVGKGMGGC